MSHRPEDNYTHVATRDINISGVRAFAKGDPVPDSTADTLMSQEEYADSIVLRSEWADRPVDEPDRPLVRGEMPEHLKKEPAKPAAVKFKNPSPKGE